jgi:hypothetical protein
VSVNNALLGVTDRTLELLIDRDPKIRAEVEAMLLGKARIRSGRHCEIALTTGTPNAKIDKDNGSHERNERNKEERRIFAFGLVEDIKSDSEREADERQPVSITRRRM